MPSINDILQDLNGLADNSSTKVASAADEPNEIAQKRQALTSALEGVQPQYQDKVASAPDASATAALEKVASDLADAEQTMTLKEAQLYGAAVFDGFVARANQYAAGAPQQKVASAQAPAYDGSSIKLASELGYAEAENALNQLIGQEKQAQYNNAKYAAAEDQRGVIAAMEKIAELTEECFEEGFAAAEQVVAHLSGQ